MADWETLKAELDTWCDNQQALVTEYKVQMLERIESAKRDEMLETLKSIDKRLKIVEEKLEENDKEEGDGDARIKPRT